jgi:hypothetical protein
VGIETAVISTNLENGGKETWARLRQRNLGEAKLKETYPHIPFYYFFLDEFFSASTGPKKNWEAFFGLLLF